MDLGTFFFLSPDALNGHWNIFTSMGENPSSKLSIFISIAFSLVAQILFLVIVEQLILILNKLPLLINLKNLEYGFNLLGALVGQFYA